MSVFRIPDAYDAVLEYDGVRDHGEKKGQKRFEVKQIKPKGASGASWSHQFSEICSRIHQAKVKPADQMTGKTAPYVLRKWTEHSTGKIFDD